jgi:hypothetical protein
MSFFLLQTRLTKSVVILAFDRMDGISSNDAAQ